MLVDANARSSVGRGKRALIQTGKQFPKGPALSQQAKGPGYVPGQQYLEYFVPNPFARNVFQFSRPLPHGGESTGVDLKAVNRAHTGSPNDPQRVFRKPVPWISDRANQSSPQILAASVRVGQNAIRI